MYLYIYIYGKQYFGYQSKSAIRIDYEKPWSIIDIVQWIVSFKYMLCITERIFSGILMMDIKHHFCHVTCILQLPQCIRDIKLNVNEARTIYTWCLRSATNSARETTPSLFKSMLKRILSAKRVTWKKVFTFDYFIFSQSSSGVKYSWCVQWVWCPQNALCMSGPTFVMCDH
jgi:hypothetical protein